MAFSKCWPTNEARRHSTKALGEGRRDCAPPRTGHNTSDHIAEHVASNQLAQTSRVDDLGFAQNRLGRLCQSEWQCEWEGEAYKTYWCGSKGRIEMGLNFPNMSRSFLPSRRAVQFWGHDETLEITFFVTEDALRRFEPNMRSNEDGMLQTFDSNRAAIYKVATRVFSHGRAGTYELTPKNF